MHISMVKGIQSYGYTVVMACSHVVPAYPQAGPTIEREANLDFKLSLKLCTSGNELWFGTNGFSDPIEASQCIVLKSSGRKITAKKLGDLAGSVRLNTQADALKFVRLRTSPSLWLTWSDTHILEIVSAKEARNIPNFGAKPNVELLGKHSGYAGVLSLSDFNRLRLQPPRVSKTIGGYLIRRWIFWSTGSDMKIGQIRESVGRDGKYSHRIVKSQSPPELSFGGFWVMPEFM